MKNTDLATATNTESLASIETPTLDNVTGGCAACGTTCAAGTPNTKPDTGKVAPFNPFPGR